MGIMTETRVATQDDAALISAHREAMFASMHIAEEDVLETMRQHNESWVRRMMREEKYLGWIVSEGDRPVASAGLLILDWPPHPFDPAGEKRGYLLNIFVEPEFRNRGVARDLVERCLADCRRRKIRVATLHASEAGRTVYERLGFHATNEMMHVETAQND